MALSDHEQKLFEQLERDLRESDPSFASSVSDDSANRLAGSSFSGVQFSVRNIVVGVVGVLIGLAVIILGVSLKLIAVGVLGFLIAAAGVYWATTKPKMSAAEGTRKVTSSPKPRSAGANSGFMKGLEDRWDNRQSGSL